MVLQIVEALVLFSLLAIVCHIVFTVVMVAVSFTLWPPQPSKPRRNEGRGL